MAENGCKTYNMFKDGIHCKRLILRPLAQERPKRARPRRLFTRVRSQVQVLYRPFDIKLAEIACCDYLTFPRDLIQIL